MEKPKPFIHVIEREGYDYGVLVIGSVALPMYIPLTIYLVSWFVSVAYALYVNIRAGFERGVADDWSGAGPFIVLTALPLLWYVGGFVWGIARTVIHDIKDVNGR